MAKLESPVKKYVTGKLPSHSNTSKLSTNFKNIPQEIIFSALKSKGYLNEKNQPTKKALEDNILDTCDKNILWNLSKIKILLEMAGMTILREYVNQEIPNFSEPVWSNLGTIGTYFDVSANEVGKWLDFLDMREKDGMGTKKSINRGFANIVEMNAGKKKTRKITQWNLELTLQLLKDSGHYLDLDYGKTLKGKGKNSDVIVITIDDKAKEFTKEFIKIFKDVKTRSQCRLLVKNTPLPIIIKSEEIMGKPGFITKEIYLK